MFNFANSSNAFGLFVVRLLAMVALLSLSGCSLFCRYCPEEGPECCEDFAQVGTVEGNGNNWVFLWIAAYKDTYVDSHDPRTFACVDDLRVAFFPRGELDIVLRRTYVDFVMPQLPAGSDITEAYLNLYNPASRGDGTSDNILIPVREARAYWPACTLTWATQPEPNNVFVGNGNFQLRLRSQSWFGTENIDSTVRRMFDNPNTNEGFILYLPAPPQGEQSAQKAFWSNNHRSRTATDVGLAPRLLVRVRLPSGTDASEIVMPPLPADNDLGALGDAVRILRIADAANSNSPWPPGWEVARGSLPIP